MQQRSQRGTLDYGTTNPVDVVPGWTRARAHLQEPVLAPSRGLVSLHHPHARSDPLVQPEPILPLTLCSLTRIMPFSLFRVSTQTPCSRQQSSRRGLWETPYSLSTLTPVQVKTCLNVVTGSVTVRIAVWVRPTFCISMFPDSQASSRSFGIQGQKSLHGLHKYS